MVFQMGNTQHPLYKNPHFENQFAGFYFVVIIGSYFIAFAGNALYKTLQWAKR
jgi:hypothetical protein